MSSPDTKKKRRMATGIGGGDNNGLDDETTMFTILAKMNDTYAK